eukprot:TRINITY_DN6564_c0_g1_i3.p2 TRINITY_DN6564_c0_g1~~TRINITY_DN6564_c0_g1_i3.p2  ORF type:complete len:122 (-),score=10.38 TRINITY_DN6564_c0_g1_i3:117-482(-)
MEKPRNPGQRMQDAPSLWNNPPSFLSPHPPSSSLAWAFKRFPPVFSFFVYLLPAPTQPSPQCRECMGERATPVCAWSALAPPRRDNLFVCFQNAPPSVVLFCSFVFNTHTPAPVRSVGNKS